MSDPLKDASEKLEAAGKRISEVAKQAQDNLLDKLKRRQAQLELEKLRTHMEMLKSDIQSRIEAAKARGDEPLTEHLTSRLAELEGQLKGLLGKHGKGKDWWKFWRRG